MLTAGDLAEAFPFRFPGPESEPVELPRHYADVPVPLGEHTWGTKAGALMLAPAFPIGGQIGGHLNFVWSADGTDYAISLHAWRPLSTAIATLRGIVGSIP